MKKFTLLLLIIFSYSYSLHSQTRKFATTAPVVFATFPEVDIPSNASDGDLNTKARMTSSLALNSRFLELRFSGVVPANTPVYVKVAMQDNKFAALIGGALGDLLTNLLSGVVGNQQIRVQAKNGSTNVVLDSQTEGYAGDRLKVAMDSAGNYYLVITPSLEYSRIRITNTVPLLSDPKWLDVYDAFYIQGTAGCAIGNYTSFSGTGLVTLVDTGVTNPQYAIDSNPANHSSLSLGLLGVASSVEQSFYFEGPSQSTDRYSVKLKLSQALITAGLLGNIQLIAHKNGSVVKTQGVSGLLNADLLGLLNSGGPVSVPFYPGEADRITVKMSGLLNVSVGQNLDLYGVVKGNFGVNVTGGGSCQMNASMPLHAEVTGCNGPYTYSWEGIADSDADAMPSTTVPGTYNYTVIVTDKYGIQQRATSQVVVEAPPVAGTVNYSQNICAGMMASDIALSGQTGTIIRWEKSLSEAFLNPVSIPVTTPVLSSEQMGPINQTTYFRAVIRHNSYPEVPAEPVAMIVKETVWENGAWSNGVPDIETAIVMKSDYQAATDLFGCTLTVQNNAIVIIPSGLDITLHGALNVSSGSFTMQTNANLIQQTNAVNHGNIIVERNSSLLYRLDYTLWCSPVKGSQTLLDFSPATMSNRFYEYSSDTNLFSSISPNTTFELAKGYYIRMPNSNSTPGYNNGSVPIRFKGIFAGVPNNGDMAIPLSHEGTGFSAIGNPYPSPINLHDFINANSGSLNPSSALYFWRKKNNTENSSYCTLTKLAYTVNSAEGGDSSEGTFTGDPALWVINPGQGFIVKAKEDGGALIFNNEMRRGVNNNQFFRTAQEEQPTMSRLWINITNSNENLSQAAIGYTSIGTAGIDFGWDGRAIINSGEIVIYTKAEDIPLAIQARPEFDIADVVPLFFRTDIAGTHKISIDHTDGLFALGQHIFLRDNMLGITHNLSSGAYSFVTEAGTFQSRFDLVYAEALNTDQLPVNVDNVVVYKEGSTIIINTGTLEMTNVEVYEIGGRLLYSTGEINAVETAIENITAENQVIIVKIATVKGKVTKKIIF